MPHKARSFNTVTCDLKDWSFPAVESRYYTDIWKGWYHMAYRANPEVPFTPLLVRPLQQKPLPTAIRTDGLIWSVLEEPLVAVDHIKFVFKPARDQRVSHENRLVIILRRSQL